MSKEKFESKNKFEPKPGFFDGFKINKHFWTKPRLTSAIPSFQLKCLAKKSKAGLLGALVSCTLLYGWDQYQQHKTRIIFNTNKPKGKVTLETTTTVEADELDTWDYSKEKNLIKRYGSEKMVYVGGGRKEGFRGIIPLPEWMEKSEKVRSSELDKTTVCHVGIVIQPKESDEESLPLIIGRQSPLGPLPTLKYAIAEGWKQFINPVKGCTVTSVMRDALCTTMANESPHIVKGTSFDTTIIRDLAVPIEFVETAIQAAETDLDPVMTFGWNNCLTTQAYALLKLAQQVDEWAKSGLDDAPSREEADAFITGCYEIIHTNIHTRGYGVLNNDIIARELEDLGPITKRIGHVHVETEESEDTPNQKL